MTLRAARSKRQRRLRLLASRDILTLFAHQSRRRIAIIDSVKLCNQQFPVFSNLDHSDRAHRSFVSSHVPGFAFEKTCPGYYRFDLDPATHTERGGNPPDNDRPIGQVPGLTA